MTKGNLPLRISQDLQAARFSHFGQSKSNLCLLRDVQDKPFVKKLAGGTSSERFQRQVDKHRTALSKNFMQPVEVPKIIDIDQGNSYSMEFVSGEMVGEFLQYCDSEDLIKVADKLTAYLESNYQNSIGNSIIPANEFSDIFMEKLIRCISSLNGNWLAIKLMNFQTRLLKCFKDLEYRQGWNHGDFSFENILVTSNQNVFVLDFLDSPIELPQIDWGRFWLDLKYGWWAQDRFKTANADLNLKKMENLLVKSANDLSLSKRELDKFALLAALRILPYTKKPSRKGHLSFATSEILDNLFL